MLVIVGCSARKNPLSPLGRWPARSFYHGAYHRYCLFYGLKLVGGDEDRVLILSAKYGLLSLGQEIDSYSLRMGEPGSITSRQLFQQAIERRILDERVILLAGSDYTGVCHKVWPDAETPLAGIGGIGKQVAWMRKRCCSS